jgi:uncharacterized protein
LTGLRVAGVDPPSPPPVAGPGIDVRARLRLALTGALRARDIIAVSALRSALSAIGNAEAVDTEAVDTEAVDTEAVDTEAVDTEAVDAGPPAAPGAASLYVAGAAVGLGATEARRRSLSTAETEQLVRAEAGERQRAAREYERAGHADQANRLRREARVLMSVVGAGDQPGEGAAPASGERSGPPPELA